MSVQLGHQLKVYVDNGAGTFNPIVGEVQHNRDGSTTLIDTSTKGTGQFATQAPGRKVFTMTVSGKKDLPDPNGLERVYALQKVYPQVAEGFQVRKYPFESGDVVFQCEMYISNWNDTAPDQDNATFSFQLTCAEAPSVDVLS